MPLNPQNSYYIGLDLGQVNDYSTFAIIQDLGDSRRAVVHLERYREELYPVIARRAAALLLEPKLYRQSELIVDATGVGPAVVDVLVEQGVRFIPVKIHGGENENERVEVATGLDTMYIPKANIIFSLLTCFQTDRLDIADLPLSPILVDELVNFQLKQSIATGHVTFSHREGEHDDLLLAAGLATWCAERMGSSTVTTNFVQTATEPFVAEREGFTVKDMFGGKGPHKRQAKPHPADRWGRF